MPGGRSDLEALTGVQFLSWEERQAARAEAERQELLRIYPNSCPTCFAAQGERCLTKTGGRTAQHPRRRG